MDIRTEVNSLEKRINELLGQGSLEEAAELILAHADDAVSLEDRFIPEKAKRELAVKEMLGGFGIYDHYYDDRSSMQVFAEKRYIIESELLRAVNPRRIKRLWEDAKPVLEKRYGRRFRSRNGLAIMNNFYLNSSYFMRSLDNLKDALSRTAVFEQTAQKNPGEGWEDIYPLWRAYHLEPAVCDAAGWFIGIIRSAKNPMKLVPKKREDMYDDGDIYPDLNQRMFRYEGKFEYRHSLDQSDLFILTDLLMKSRKNGISFLDALNIRNPRYAEATGFKNDMYYFGNRTKDRNIGLLQQAVYKSLNHHYTQRDDAGFASFMEWYTSFLLKRWKSTAVDYERLFSFHNLSGWDRWHIQLFYELREGKPLNEHDERIMIRRYPEVLRLMTEDGIIAPEDIDPPLKDWYPGPDEILTVTGKALPAVGIERVLNLSMVHTEPSIITSMEARAMLPGVSEARDLPAVFNDMSELGDVLDLSKTYQVLYQGAHTLFIVSESGMQNGEIRPGSVYRFALLRDGSEAEGKTIMLNGRRLTVRKERDHSKLTAMKDRIWDVNNDAVPLDTNTFIVDISPDEFGRDYFRDFMAHAMIHFPCTFTLEQFKDHMDKIDTMDVLGSGVYIHPTGRARLYTFELGGKFAFRIKDEDAENAHVQFVSESLRRYLEEVGLPYHMEIELDEEGREFAEAKRQDREFQEENLAGIVESLQGNNLARALCFAFMNSEYKTKGFGESGKPCEVCGDRYIQGSISRSDGDEYICFYASELHTLSKHPETYAHELRHLRRIHRLLCDAEEYTPLFMKCPEAAGDIALFSSVFMDYVNANLLHSAIILTRREVALERKKSLRMILD